MCRGGFSLPLFFRASLCFFVAKEDTAEDSGAKPVRWRQAIVWFSAGSEVFQDLLVAPVAQVLKRFDVDVF